MSEAELDGKVALVTGAGSGIGLGWNMTQALLRAGARVALMDVNSASLQDRIVEARTLAGEDSAIAVTGDVRMRDDAQAAVEQTIQRLGGLHILVNNAGINAASTDHPDGPPFWDLDPEAWMRVIATNLSGPFQMARAATAHLRSQGWGRIIGVTTSFDTMLRAAPYGPAKAGHEALVAVMARQLEGSSVTANVLVPGGATLTNMTAGRRDPSGMLRPQLMQDPVVWLASDAANDFNGRRIIARFWDASLPIEERLAKASAPVAWPELSRRATASRGGI